MGIFQNIKKTITGYLPGIRQPSRDSFYDAFMNQYRWSFETSNKSQGDLDVYYNAFNNVYVRQCIQVYCDESLINGFEIKDNVKETVNFPTVNYLTHLFNDPQGKKNNDTFATMNSQIWTSWLLTGDAFVEVNYDENTGNIPIGFKFVPTEAIAWFPDTEQWGIRSSTYRYEQDELIHIYNPRVTLKDSKWGSSPIDAIGLAIALEFQGMMHNKSIFENNGIDPKGVVTFDKEADNFVVGETIKRIEQTKNKKGIMFLQGGNYQRTGNSNTDMDFINLMNYARDQIITGFSVQPSKVGVRETASLGSGTGESQDKDFSKTLAGKCKIIENAFNKVLGRSGFSEMFQYVRMDTENKQLRAQIEDIQIKNGTRYINEVRKDYGLEPVPWGNTPMSYGMFGVTTDVAEQTEVVPIGVLEQENKQLRKTLATERLKNDYPKIPRRHQ